MDKLKKYQVSIVIKKKGDRNSAATKAVTDCTNIFKDKGYVDLSYTIAEGLSKLTYYFNLFKILLQLYKRIGKNAIVAVQYPMLNKTFKYLIMSTRGKRIKFFCIIHDIETLRAGGVDDYATRREARDLNRYDCLIVHNDQMKQWLMQKGVTKKMVPLKLFDYLTNDLSEVARQVDKTVAYAGNLAKSDFIYDLSKIPGWKFNVYGPSFQNQKQHGKNLSWRGEYSPEQIVQCLDGSFGLIWDGTSIHECDPILGNYLRYNNPHKFSLYLAAGLPVIAPAEAAIAEVIEKEQLGITVNSLDDLARTEISTSQYQRMLENCRVYGSKVRSGFFFTAALDRCETYLLN